MVYNGDGSYAVGGTDAVTAINDVHVDFIFDTVEYHDLLGRKIQLEESLSINTITGIYIKSYLYHGTIVKSEKIVR